MHDCEVWKNVVWKLPKLTAESYLIQQGYKIDISNNGVGGEVIHLEIRKDNTFSFYLYIC